MSELQKLDAFVADAERAADEGIDPNKCLQKYEPNLHPIWKTYYYARITENEMEAA